MKITGFDLITSLIRISAIIAGEPTRISKEDWVFEKPESDLTFHEEIWDRVAYAGFTSHMEQIGGEGYSMSVTNGQRENEILLTNNRNREQTYRMHDPSRVDTPWLFMKMAPKDIHEIDVIGKKVFLEISLE
ncbi:hypothetical protein PCASD_24320 [Puccinia coronata f. sp. avenae]|uniref:Uncharacterized protein n=1 Tax=Puccinia coronata f. sp. avenae TaxID=200324 RepID=A0A2N5SDL5_9BASI|nr:hypothetical protein PCASD_24320 [Puccinia coronata f. sp. avenae]